jgi:hypothetical protein
MGVTLRKKLKNVFNPSLSFYMRKGGDFPQPLEMSGIQAVLGISD